MLQCVVLWMGTFTPPKCWYPPTKLHRVTTQNTVILIFNTVRTMILEGFHMNELSILKVELRKFYLQGDTKKWELLKNPTKIEEIQEKKFIDRN